MPIGTVYKAQPPRKRSTAGLQGNERGTVVSPTSPSLPTGRGQSDLESRIAEFSISNNSGAPGSPKAQAPSELRVTSPVATSLPSGGSSGALPPKSPLLSSRQSAPTRAGNNLSYTEQHRPLSLPGGYPEEAAHSAARSHSAAAYEASQLEEPTLPVRQASIPSQRAGNTYSADAPRADMGTMGGLDEQTQNGTSAGSGAKILIIYYSMYGHVRLLADSVRQGVESVTGCTAEIYRVPETLSNEVLKRMNAPPKHTMDPELTHEMLHKLAEADGIMFGLPTRFGMMPAQMKAFFDSTVKLWTKGDLVGKPAATFFSTATQGGGQETTALTTITQLAHHGMIYVPPGYSFGGAMFSLNEVHGGSPYGCGTIANGDGSRLPSKYELDFARHQGAQFASVAMKLR